jgi:hypothetical protein
MHRTRTRLVGVAAALSTVAIAAASSTASVATAAPTIGPATVVLGPTIITTASSTFVNTNTQVSASDNTAGGQFGP